MLAVYYKRNSHVMLHLDQIRAYKFSYIQQTAYQNDRLNFINALLNTFQFFASLVMPFAIIFLGK